MAHLIDDERILSYRMLCVARGEQQSLAGFDENLYVAYAAAEERSWQDLPPSILHWVLRLLHSYVLCLR